MKTRIITQILLVVFLAPVGGVMAQNKTEKEKKETEKTIIIDGKKLTGEELEKELQKIKESHEFELQNLEKNMFYNEKEALEQYKQQLQDIDRDRVAPYYRRGGVVATVPGITFDNYNVWALTQNNSLNISKDLQDVTYATDFSYEVKNDNSTISFNVNGSLSGGELKIILKKPDGTVFQEIKISPLADINWNQQFSWEEDDQDDYLGKWVISMKADQAKGKYSIRVNSR